MHCMIILYNPYYQHNTIESHLEILKRDGIVAFGKIKSRLKDNMKPTSMIHQELEVFYSSITSTNPLQLFLTDYANLFVAKVTKITDFTDIKAPTYYKEKELEVEKWFIVEDMREIVLNDFATIRDHHLPNFTTPHNGNRTFALYGNNYKYPLIVNMKEYKNYFKDNIKHYKDIFKSKDYLAIKHNLQEYVFGLTFMESMHPDSIDNIISAEIEYQENKNDPLYDFTGIVIWYSKTIEQEISIFARALFSFLIKKDKKVGNIEYSVQQQTSNINDFLHGNAKTNPSLGTFKYIFSSRLANTIEHYFKPHIRYFVTKQICKYISEIQNVRNDSAHAKKIKKQEAQNIRDAMLGVSRSSVLSEIVKIRLEINTML